MIHADTKASNLVDQKMMYVGISRAKVMAAVYTDDRVNLVSGIIERAGERQVALASSISASTNSAMRGATKVIGAGLVAAGAASGAGQRIYSEIVMKTAISGFRFD